MIWEVTHDVEGSFSLLQAINHVKNGVLASHHINTLNNIKVKLPNHKELLMENYVNYIDSINAANVQTLKKIIQKD